MQFLLWLGVCASVLMAIGIAVYYRRPLVCLYTGPRAKPAWVATGVGLSMIVLVLVIGTMAKTGTAGGRGKSPAPPATSAPPASAQAQEKRLYVENLWNVFQQVDEKKREALPVASRLMLPHLRRLPEDETVLEMDLKDHKPMATGFWIGETEGVPLTIRVTPLGGLTTERPSLETCGSVLEDQWLSLGLQVTYGITPGSDVVLIRLPTYKSQPGKSITDKYRVHLSRKDERGKMNTVKPMLLMKISGIQPGKDAGLGHILTSSPSNPARRMESSVYLAYVNENGNPLFKELQVMFGEEGGYRPQSGPRVKLSTVGVENPLLRVVNCTSEPVTLYVAVIPQ